MLDWNMPNMNGEQVVEVIRANGYMVKPFNEEAIFKTLNTITAKMPK